MFGKTQKTIPTAVFLLMMALLWTACAGAETAVEPTLKPISTPTSTQAIATITATPAPLPSPTATKEPLTLYLGEGLPTDIIKRDDLVDIMLSDDPGANVWLGWFVEAPDGEMLAKSHWVYALVAPFPTLMDGITLADLQAFWRGDLESPLLSVTKLYVPESITRILDEVWGKHSSITVEGFSALPEPDVLWDENAWAMLPFEDLTPKLKVITIDGISPLFKDFLPENYPLTVTYHLVENLASNREISDEEQQKMTNVLKASNRDPEKMTTLVMTGVTALVRATAHRMEIHGVRYPAEKIVHWLSEADLTHISNEVSFYEDCPFPDPDFPNHYFCSDPKYIELLEYVGADIIELTGNHNNDMLYVHGVDVVPFTLDLYLAHGMAYYGGGLDLADAKSPLLITHHGNQLAFIGCNAFGPDYAWATEDQGGAAPCDDFLWMADEIKRLREEGYLPIATFQYYEDYYPFAKEWLHVRDFGIMAEAGAVIVNGSQAHYPKAMDFSDDAYIDYGLGNLFFDQMGYTDMYGNNLIQVRWEIIQRHTFYDGRHLHVELLTAMLEDYAQPRPMTTKERLVFLDELFRASGWNSR